MPPLGTHCQDCVRDTVDDRTARRIEAMYLQSAARSLLPRERVADCLRKLIPGHSHVDIVLSLDGSGAHLANLQTCSRVWQCPVCASRISSERSKELMTATTKWFNSGGFCALFTFTLSHTHDDALTTILEALREAHRAFKSGRWFQDVKGSNGWRGSVAALEVTYGGNGWHPHLHELVFFDVQTGREFSDLTSDAKRRWTEAVAKQQQRASWSHGLDIRETSHDVYEYVSKYGKPPSATRWTAESEVTRAVVKRSSRDGKTAWQLLSDFADGDKRSGRLFVEYSYAFKGKNQLVWSRGLRDMLGMLETTDEQIVDDELQAYIVLLSLSRDDWKKLIRLPGDVRAELLKVAALGDADELKSFVGELIDL